MLSNRAAPLSPAAALNAGVLALLDAGIAMRDFVVACSVVQVQRTLLLGASPRAAVARTLPTAARRVRSPHHATRARALTLPSSPPPPRSHADPSHIELTSGGAELTVALLPRSGKVTLATMDARLPLDRFEGMLAAATDGCRQVFELLNSAALEHAGDSLRRRAAPAAAAAVAADDDGEGSAGASPDRREAAAVMGGGGDEAEEDVAEALRREGARFDDDE